MSRLPDRLPGCFLRYLQSGTDLNRYLFALSFPSVCISRGNIQRVTVKKSTEVNRAGAEMKTRTGLIHYGRQRIGKPGLGVNIPVHRASTIVSPDFASYLARFDNDQVYNGVTYGAIGTGNAFALAEAVSVLEEGHATVVTSSGLSACTVALGALVKQGDHVLVTDTVYGPTRLFCDQVLSRYGVEVEYFEPTIDQSIDKLIRPETVLIFLEAPGSLTFEMQNIKAITDAAHAASVLTLMDNTWATPLYYKPLANNIDVSIQAGTKYIAGHSDLVIGLITVANQGLHQRIADHARFLGDVAGPDDCYLALRGLRSMAVRLQQQYASTLEVVEWLHQRDEVKAVLYPPHPSDPGHELWRESFDGGASLFGLVLHCDNIDRIGAFVDHLEYFQIGSSWGGFESLVAANLPPLSRRFTVWDSVPCLLRFHIGLEDPQDLIDDLAAGLRHL